MNACAEDMNESEKFRTSTKQLRVILDDKYENKYSKNVMKNQCQHLTETQRNEFLKLFQKLKELCYVTLGNLKTGTVEF